MSTISISWKSCFKAGIALYKEGNYEGAVEAFTKAISLNANDKQLFDSRAAALERLGRHNDALRDAKRILDIAPTSWQGYARSARLFLAVKKPEAALKMADMALERLKATDTKRHAELALVRKLAIEAMQQNVCHILRLPVEMLVAILSMVIGESNTVMLRSMTVCRAWRNLIIGTPSFWGRLTISGKTGKKKIETWLERSSGRIPFLYLTKTFSLASRPNTFRQFPPEYWSRLRGLHLDFNRMPIHDALPEGVVEALRLETLHVAGRTGLPVPSCSLTQLLDIDTSTLKDFTLSARTSMFPSPFLEKCENIVNLLLDIHFISTSSLQLILQSARRLEVVAICQRARAEDADNVSLDFFGHLSHLKQLAISSPFTVGRWSSLMRLPNLASFTLASSVVDAERDVEEDEAFRALKDLSLLNGSLCSTPITWLLERMPALSRVRIIGGRVLPGTSDPFLERLSERDNMICAHLEHLEVTSAPMVTAGPIVRIVKSRLCPLSDKNEAEVSTSLENRIPIEGEGSGNGMDLGLDVHPIQTLILDDCPNMDPEVLPWLRAHVPVVSCKVASVLRRKGRKPIEFLASSGTIVTVL